MAIQIQMDVENLAAGGAPLLCVYPGQTDAQPAYVQMDEHGVITADHSGEIGNAIPHTVLHGVDLRFRVDPCVDGFGLCEFLESERGRHLLERIHAGHCVTWDGSNRVGSLNEDATRAVVDLERALQECPARDAEIFAESKDLWEECIDPLGTTPFDSISREERVGLAQAVIAFNSPAPGRP